MKNIIPIILAGLTTVATAARVEFEAERPAKSNVPVNLPAKSSPQLSGGAELNLKSKTPIAASYEFTAPAEGTYTVWAREYYRNGQSPLRWRVDAGPWREVKQDWGLTMSEMVDSHTFNDWGQVKLTPGKHTLDIETTAPRCVNPPQDQPAKVIEGVAHVARKFIRGDEHWLWIDKFILTTEPLVGVDELARLYQQTGHLPAYEPKDAADWYPLEMALDNFAPSILDVIQPTPQPIGDTPSDRLRRVGGKFLYPDGREFIAHGTSAPTAPPKSEAAYYAKRARRLGFTCIRLHALDGDLCDQDGGPQYRIDSQRLDRMEYFIACLKREGIYVMIDPLYNWINPMSGPDDGLPEDVSIRSRIRTPFYWDPALQAKNKQFIKTLLEHRNPYTGLRNGDDPSVAFFQVCNENSLMAWGFVDDQHPYFLKQLEAQFNQWLVARYGSREQLAAAWGGALKATEDPTQGTVQREPVRAILHQKPDAPAGRLKRSSDTGRFLYDVQVKFYSSVRAYIEKELGFTGLLYNGSGWFGLGWLDVLDIAGNLPGMDFFDQHGYASLREGVLQPKTDTAERKWPRFSLMEFFASKAPKDLPWVASEWNNSWGLEGPLTMAAYGSLHGWDGLFQYRLDSFDGLQLSGGRSTKAGAYLQSPLASLAFARRAVREADVVARRGYPAERLFDPTRQDDDYKNRPWTGLHTLIGKCELAFDNSPPVNVGPAPFVRAGGLFVDSQTKELTWNAQDGALHIKAPGLQGVVGQLDGQPVNLGAVTMTIQPDFASVALGAVDGNSLAESKRMLLCAVGRTHSVEEVLKADASEEEKKRLKHFPLLMKPPVGEVTFAQPVKAVYALDLSGQRKGEVKLHDGGRKLRLDNTHRTAWFEVVR